MPETSTDNSPAESARATFVLPEKSKLEAMAEFAAGAGHEINNPLATIIGRAQLLLKDEQDPQRRQMLLSIGAQAYRIRDMIGDAMLFGRPPQPEFKSVVLAQAIREVLARQHDDLLVEKITIEVQVAESIRLRADETQLAIVLHELIRNSRQAIPAGGGQIQISAAIGPEHPGNAWIEITDSGRGFTITESEHAFDPFFSGRQAGRGLGFGLPKCWRIIDQHQGEIAIHSTAGGLTIVRIRWPLGT